MRIGFGMLIFAALAVAGCGSNASSPASGFAAQPTKPAGLQEYPAAQALADDVTKYGHSCSMTPEGGGMNSVDSGRCCINGTEMVLGIYASQPQIDKQIAFVEEVLGGNNVDYGMLADKNWTINCGSRAACEAVQADLGGSVSAPFG